MQATTSHRFSTLAEARHYALAGNATLTLESLKTGAHFTYRIRRAKNDAESTRQAEPLWFVSLLSGPNNENDYNYLGIIRNGSFTLTKASKAGAEAASVKAFGFFLSLNELHPSLVIMHTGKCCRCGRTLTEPESLRTGVGPECREKMGL